MSTDTPAAGPAPGERMAPLVDAGLRRAVGLPPVAPLALGTWRLVGAVEDALAAMEAALEAGMNLLDTADVYGLDHGGAGFGAVEETVGGVLRRAPSLRESVVLTTKGGIDPGVPYDSSARHLRSACEASLRRLGVEHVDLYLVHRPDPFTHPSALVESLEDLRAAGKIGAWGLSNHTAFQHDSVMHLGGGHYVAHQLEYSAASLGTLTDGTLDRCLRDDVLPLAWSPLAGGRLLSGEGVRGELVEVLDRLATREDVDRATVALAFVLAHPARPVAIIGSTRPDRIASTTRALGVSLTRSDVYDIVEASTGEPLP